MIRDEDFETCRALLANSVDAYCAAGFSKEQADLILRLAGSALQEITKKREDDARRREQQRIADEWQHFEETLDEPLRDLAHQHRPEGLNWQGSWVCASCKDTVEDGYSSAHWPCQSARLIRKLAKGES